MTTLISPTFTMVLGPDAALVPRTPAIADAYLELLTANQQRFAQWEPWAAEAPTPEGVRSFLDRGARAWVDGTELPVGIAVAVDDGWQLVGSAGLRIDAYTRSAQCGYWIDAAFEGRGLVTRTMTALLDAAFGPLALDRVALHCDVANARIRAVAGRLGFTAEGVARQAILVAGGRRDDMVFGLLAEEWRQRQAGRTRTDSP